MDVDGNWTEKLISSVENKPLLYNKALKEYSNRDLKEKAWMEVCENVIPDWGQLTEDIKKIKSRETQRRWTNLHSCFAREMREQKKGTSGQAAQKRCKYIYFDQLLFLLPTVEERETESNLEPPESCLDEEDSLVPSEPPAVEQTPKTISYEQFLLDILKEKSDEREEIDEDKTFALSLVPALQRLSCEKKFEAKLKIMGVLHTLKSNSCSYPT